MAAAMAAYGAVEAEPPADAWSAPLFRGLLLVQVAMYLEAGAVPALLQQFTRSFALDPQEQGLLGGVVFLALALTSPWCATLFRRFSPRALLGGALAANNLAVLAFGLASARARHAKALLVCLRAVMGAAQAFHCVYCPLWVHDYAPKAKRGAWMSYLQASVPIGISLGYLAGSISLWLATPRAADADTDAGAQADADADANVSLCSGVYCWRWPFLFQFALVVPLCVLLFLVPERHIRLKSTRRQSFVIVDATEDDGRQARDYADVESVPSSSSSPASPADQAPLLPPASPPTRPRPALSLDLDAVRDSLEETVSRWANLGLLLRHHVYVWLVLGLSALFFVVAGVQFWTTLYLETNTRDSLVEIHTAYLLVSGTGPILGVFFGGWLIDRCGGYAGAAHQARALRVCMLLGGAGCLASLPVSFVSDTAAIAAFLWLMLFCGGAILPACSGIVISAAPPRLRPLASSVAYSCYNLFGYAASNYVPGLIMDLLLRRRPAAGRGACDDACTYRTGFRIVLLWSVWAFFCLACSAVASARHLAAVQARQRGLKPGELE